MLILNIIYYNSYKVGSSYYKYFHFNIKNRKQFLDLYR